jgi:hypothetical protein
MANAHAWYSQAVGFVQRSGVTQLSNRNGIDDFNNPRTIAYIGRPRNVPWRCQRAPIVPRYVSRSSSLRCLRNNGHGQAITVQSISPRTASRTLRSMIPQSRSSPVGFVQRSGVTRRSNRICIDHSNNPSTIANKDRPRNVPWRFQRPHRSSVRFAVHFPSMFAN